MPASCPFAYFAPSSIPSRPSGRRHRPRSPRVPLLPRVQLVPGQRWKIAVRCIAAVFVKPLPLVSLPPQACFCSCSSSVSATAATAAVSRSKFVPGMVASSVSPCVTHYFFVSSGAILEPCSPGAMAGGGGSVLRDRRRRLRWCRRGWTPSVSDAIRGYRSHPQIPKYIVGMKKREYIWLL